MKLMLHAEDGRCSRTADLGHLDDLGHRFAVSSVRSQTRKTLSSTLKERTTMNIKIDEITIAADRRRIDEAKVRELAASIQKVGLLNPITVTPEKKLIAGEHRLEAVKMLGLTEIEVHILQGDELLQQLAEIDENLVRNELDPISVGELAIRRDEILEALGLRAKSGENQYSQGGRATVAPPLKTTQDIPEPF